MAQPVTPHDHIVAQAARQRAACDAARAVSEEIATARQADIDAKVAQLEGGRPR